MEIEIEQMIDSKKEIERKIAHLNSEQELMRLEKNKLYMALSNVDKKLMVACEHDWARENYLYSPLYCLKCGVIKT